MPTNSFVWSKNGDGDIDTSWNNWSTITRSSVISDWIKATNPDPKGGTKLVGGNMFKKVKDFYKKQKKRLTLSLESTQYESFVNAEEERMEFGMEVTLGQVDERIAFGSMAKGQKRYGSTSRHLKRDDPQGFAYTVQKGDTLQGIAVKFRVTTEQIRRTNQLWTNDSLFLRDKLIIPIHVENGSRGDDGQSYSSSIASPVSNSSGRNSHTMPTNGSTITSKTFSSENPPNTPYGLSSPQGGPSFQSPESMSTETGSKHWTHPLSDSFEFDEGLTTPDSIQQDSDFLTSPNSITDGMVYFTNHNSYQNGGDSPAVRNGRSSDKDNGTRDSPTRHYLVKDHSEKSVDEFLSRIDSAIASTREKTLPLTQNGKQWVTFESESESNQHFHRSTPGGASNQLSDGRVLRQSLRNLEKRQEELFQL